MKWGYSGYTKSETRRLVHSVKEKEDFKSHLEDIEEFDTANIKNSKKIPKKLKDKEF